MKNTSQVHAGVGNSRSFSVFPLTPALSLGERENRLSVARPMEAISKSQRRVSCHPLPWGEGEKSNQTSSANFVVRASTFFRHLSFVVCHLHLFVGLSLLLVRIQAADWPTYRADYARSGISAEKISTPLNEAW